MPRLEDERLLTGAGRYCDDIDVAGQAHAVVLRSPQAHALIDGIDAAAARVAAGVLAVYSSGDLLRAGIKAIPSLTRTPPFARERTGRADGRLGRWPPRQLPLPAGDPPG